MRRQNVKLVMEYDGSAYLGWQRLGKQKDKSIQGIFEEQLSKLLQEEIKIIGSGRTDVGVHALGQVANFYTSTKLSLEEIKAAMNIRLPKDIQIINIEKVFQTFHSRYDAKAKIYEYHIEMGEKQNVFTRKYAAHIPGSLDIEKMREAARLLVGTHDFKGFSSLMKDGRDTIRKIYEVNIYKIGSQLILEICGEGFLYHMVRIIVGTLVEIGQGKKSLYDILRILEKKDRQLAGPTVASKGLFLKKVVY